MIWQRNRIFYVILFFLFIVSSCVKRMNGSEFMGELTIHYQLNNYDLLTVIWLEDEQGNYLKTLMVSDWLSYDGHRFSDICPDWCRVADWQNVSKSEFDAVTSATPEKGKHEIKLDCEKEKMSNGIYYYFIQTHIGDEYNILYKGKIGIGNKSNSNIAEVTYVPDKHPDSTRTTLLSDVWAEYKIKN